MLNMIFSLEGLALVASLSALIGAIIMLIGLIKSYKPGKEEEGRAMMFGGAFFIITGAVTVGVYKVIELFK